MAILAVGDPCGCSRLAVRPAAWMVERNKGGFLPRRARDSGKPGALAHVTYFLGGKVDTFPVSATATTSFLSLRHDATRNGS